MNNTQTEGRTSRFRYQPSSQFPDRHQISRVAEACVAVDRQLHSLDLKELRISDYNLRYLGEKFAKPEYEYCIVSYMLGSMLALGGLDYQRCTLVDYGAGSGLICLVAKKLGFGRVIYVDIYEGSINDARLLGRALALPADEYIHGDVGQLTATLSRTRSEAHALVSHDCIEHIYDIEDFLRALARVPANRLHVWLSSAANPLRPKTRRKLAAVAHRAECVGQQKAWGDKLDRTLKPYREVRKDMIRMASPDLPPETLELLAGLTRGLREQDIREAIRRYRESGVFPPQPGHPTNTCDPTSGNWAERLMNPFELTNKARACGVDLSAWPGYWSPDPSSRIKNLLKWVTNVVIAHTGTAGLRFAPYYVLRGYCR